METTVSYAIKITGEAAYNQKVNFFMSDKEFQSLNDSIIERLKEIDTKTIKTAKEMTDLMYLKQFNEGLNFTTITSLFYILNFFTIKNYRIKTNRNTLINIVIK